MKKLFILFLLISFATMAQNPSTEDIIGSYRLPSNDPQGGQSVLIFDNNRFATFYFGGGVKRIMGN